MGKDVSWRQVKPPLGMFGLAMTPTSVSHRPKMLREPKRCLTITGVNFRPMPSMYLSVSVMNLHDRQYSL